MKPALFALLALATLLPLLPAGSAELPGVTYELKIACPDNSPFCPILAEDASDAMGAPAIAVDPDRPDHMIIASLHGGADNINAPSPISRSGQAFTTFTSQNGGRSWTDNPFSPPQDLGNGVYGEYPALTLDPYGHVFVGSLYSKPVDGGGWTSLVAAQKFRSIDDINSNQDGRYNVQYLAPTGGDASMITQVWFEFNPVTDNMTMMWHELPTGRTPPPEEEPEDPILSLIEDAALQPEPGNETANLTGMGRIGLIWSGADVSSPYRRQADDDNIGPCRSSTNPVIAEDWLYVGCRIGDEAPFRWNEQAQPDDIALFRMNPDGGTPQYLGLAPLHGEPKIGVRSDGRISLMTADVHNETLRLDAVFGQYDPKSKRIAWNNPQSYGHLVPELERGTVLQQANIQDMLYREYSGVVQIILKQYVERPGEDDGTARADALQPEIFKAILAIDEQHGLLAHIDLQIGQFSERSRDTSLIAYSDEAYNDPSDDFLEMPAAPHRYQNRHLGVGYQREYFAVGSYGIVHFAELVEITDLRGPLWANPPPPPPPPTPAPAPAGSLALAGAGALSATAIVTGAGTAVKRKHISGAGKKRNGPN